MNVEEGEPLFRTVDMLPQVGTCGAAPTTGRVPLTASNEVLLCGLPALRSSGRSIQARSTGSTCLVSPASSNSAAIRITWSITNQVVSFTDSRRGHAGPFGAAWRSGLTGGSGIPSGEGPCREGRPASTADRGELAVR